MKRGVLITLPRSDDVTEYLYAFSSPIIQLCLDKLIQIKKIENSEANKNNFEKVLKKLDYNFIVFNGHGSQNCITGHKEEPLIIVGKNEQILKNRITYARSCWAAAGVGKESMKNNSFGCFIGYKIPFMFLFDSTRISNPVKDNTAKIFFDTSNIVPFSLIKGNSGQEAHENSKKAMLKAINKALKNKDSEAIAQVLWNNYMGQSLVGNKEAKI